ncbi:unnamed protein product [Closterium sp. NIES-54]
MSPHAHRCRTSVARLLLSHIAPPRPTLPPSAYLAPSAQLAPAPPDSRQPLHTLIPHRSAPDSAALNSACTPLVPTSYWLRDSATSAIADGLSDSRVLLLYVCPAEPVFPALIAPSAQSILPLVESAARRYSSSALKSPANAEGSSREVEGLPGSVGNEDLEKVLGAEQMGGFGTSEKSGGRGGGEEEQACGSGGELLRGMEGEEKAVGRGGGGEQRIVVYRGRWMQGLRLMVRDRPSPSLPSPPAAAVCCLHAARCRLNLAQMVGVAWLVVLRRPTDHPPPFPPRLPARPLLSPLPDVACCWLDAALCCLAGCCCVLPGWMLLCAAWLDAAVCCLAGCCCVLPGWMLLCAAWLDAAVCCLAGCCCVLPGCRLKVAQLVGVASLAVPIAAWTQGCVSQLVGVASLAVPIAAWTQGASLPLGTSVAVAAVVGGAAAASACLWFYSSRYVGELALIGPAPEAAAAGDGDGDGDGQQWRVCISTLDFWGNREVSEWRWWWGGQQQQRPFASGSTPPDTWGRWLLSRHLLLSIGMGKMGMGSSGGCLSGNFSYLTPPPPFLPSAYPSHFRIPFSFPSFLAPLHLIPPPSTHHSAPVPPPKVLSQQHLRPCTLNPEPSAHLPPFIPLAPSHLPFPPLSLRPSQCPSAATQGFIAAASKGHSAPQLRASRCALP